MGDAVIYSTFSRQESPVNRVEEISQEGDASHSSQSKVSNQTGQRQGSESLDCRALGDADAVERGSQTERHAVDVIELKFLGCLM